MTVPADDGLSGNGTDGTHANTDDGADADEGPPRETLAALAARGEDEPTFDAPWQARAFAVAVALGEREGTFADFQSRFAERIDATDAERMSRDVEGVYYEEWLACLEELLFESGVVSADDLARRQAEFEAGDRDESEFVVGTADGR